jgi:prephenate dehydrogenase
MNEMKRIGIIGLGLMGGSLALALKKASSDAFYFMGLDHNKRHTKEALKRGIVDEVVEDVEALLVCDVLFLAVPVNGIIKIIKNLPMLPQTLTIIDLGSTKEKIAGAIPVTSRANFVTAHPMTGTEQSGPKAVLEGLYKNKIVVLCDFEKSGIHQQEVAQKLFTLIGANLVTMEAKEHDRHAAYISHMPHALSFALANAVMKQEDNTSIINLAGGGFKDMSRIAQSSPNMWEDIFRQNRPNILQAIHSLQSELKKCEKMIEHEEWEALNSWMREANKLHDIL